MCSEKILDPAFVRQWINAIFWCATIIIRLTRATLSRCRQWVLIDLGRESGNVASDARFGYRRESQRSYGSFEIALDDGSPQLPPLLNY